MGRYGIPGAVITLVGDGRIVHTAGLPYRYPERAPGGLIATAEDIARFCLAGMPDFSDQRVLADSAMEQLYFPQVEGLGIFICAII